MTQTAHYRLTSDEFLAINSQLTAAQLRIYLHYRTLDPFGDRRVEICTKAIAEILGLTQRTVQLSLNKLSILGLLIWEKGKSFVRRSVDRLGEIKIAEAKSGSPRRNVDRQQQLELSLEADSATSQSSSILFNLDQEDFETFEDEEAESNSEISLEDALKQIRAIADVEIADHEITDVEIADHQIADREIADHEVADVETQKHIDEPEVSEAPKKPTEVDFSRRAVEDFVLNQTKKQPRCRRAYFAKFTSANWKMWEDKYRAAHATQPTFKPFVAEIIEVAPLEIAKSALSGILETLKKARGK